MLESDQSPQMDQGEGDDQELEPCAWAHVGAFVFPVVVLLPIHYVVDVKHRNNNRHEREAARESGEGHEGQSSLLLFLDPFLHFEN
jgi:hypothetical protein